MLYIFFISTQTLLFQFLINTLNSTPWLSEDLLNAIKVKYSAKYLAD